MAFIHINHAKTEALVCLRPVPNADWIKQDPEQNHSDVSFSGVAAHLLECSGREGPLSVTSVHRNGIEVPFVALSPTDVRIAPPIRLGNERLAITCALV